MGRKRGSSVVKEEKETKRSETSFARRDLWALSSSSPSSAQHNPLSCYYVSPFFFFYVVASCLTHETVKSNWKKKKIHKGFPILYYPGTFFVCVCADDYLTVLLCGGCCCCCCFCWQHTAHLFPTDTPYRFESLIPKRQRIRIRSARKFQVDDPLITVFNTNTRMKNAAGHF